MGKKSGQNAPPDTAMTRMGGPWMPTQQPLQDVIGQLSAYYGNRANTPGYGPNVIAPFNPAENLGILNMTNAAKAGIPGLSSGISSLAPETSRAATSMPGYDLYSKMMAGGFQNPATNIFAGLADRGATGAGAQTGIDALSQYASGGMLGANPYRDAMLQQGLGDITKNYSDVVNPSIEGMVSRSGAGGGGSVEALMRGQAQAGLGKSLSDYTTNFLGGAYGTDTAQRLAAAGQLPGAEATQIGTGLNAAGGLANIFQQNLGTQIGGATGAGGLEQQNLQNRVNVAGALPGLFQGTMAPGQALFGAGQLQQQQQQAQQQEAQNRYRFGQSATPNFINQYLQQLLAAGAAGNPAVAGQYAQQVMNQPSDFQVGFNNLLALGSVATGAKGAMPASPPAPAAATPWG